MRKTFRTTGVALAVMLAASAVVQADLKYTMRAEMKPAPTGASGPANPMLAQAGAAMQQQLVPSGPAEIVYIVSDKGVRTEFKQAAMGNTAGTITLARPNGDIISIDTNAKTYWKMTGEQAAKAMAMVPVKPVVTTKRTGEFAAVAGVRSERMTFDIRIDLPIPAELLSQLPPGFPTSIAMNGEAWYAADQYKNYGELVAKGAASMKGMGFEKLMTEGLMLKQVMRSDLFSGQQFELTTTVIAEEKVDAALFEIPAGFKEVPSPLAAMGGGGGR